MHKWLDSMSDQLCDEWVDLTLWNITWQFDIFVLFIFFCDVLRWFSSHRGLLLYLYHVEFKSFFESNCALLGSVCLNKSCQIICRKGYYFSFLLWLSVNNLNQVRDTGRPPEIYLQKLQELPKFDIFLHIVIKISFYASLIVNFHMLFSNLLQA